MKVHIMDRLDLTKNTRDDNDDNYMIKQVS